MSRLIDQQEDVYEPASLTGAILLAIYAIRVGGTENGS
jgi:hypothetical protein